MLHGVNSLRIARKAGPQDNCTFLTHSESHDWQGLLTVSTSNTVQLVTSGSVWALVELLITLAVGLPEWPIRPESISVLLRLLILLLFIEGVSQNGGELSYTSGCK